MQFFHVRGWSAGCVMGLIGLMHPPDSIGSSSFKPATADWVIARSQTAERPFAFAVDAAGHNYIAGGSSFILFFEKRDSLGRLLWMRRISLSATPSISRGTLKSLSVDARENSYLAGEFHGTARFQPISTQSAEIVELASPGGLSTFLAKYDRAGLLLWVKQFAGNGAGMIVSDGQESFFFARTRG